MTAPVMSAKRLFATVTALLTATLPAAALADTLIENVDGIRVERDGTVERFTAMLIDDDGKVAKLYQRRDKLPKEVDYKLDGDGRVLIPSFIDSHLHLTGTGLAAMILDLSETASLAEAQEKIADYAARYPNRGWIIGRGWNHEKWGLGRFPTASDLDAAVSDRPVWLMRADGHAGWANSAAMVAAGVTAKTVDPEGGRIIRDAAKAPSGVFVDNAMGAVAALVPEPRPEERDIALDKAQQLLLAHGITAVADMGTTIDDWQALRRSGDAGRLRIRVMGYAGGIEQMVTIAGAEPTPWLYGDRLFLGGVKLYLDGALGSRGAWLLADYADAPGERGLPLRNGTQLRNMMSRAAMAGFQPAVHAIGDAANREVLDSILELNETYTGDRRWRVEHAQIVDPIDLPRFAQLGAVASVQPVHQTSDRQMAEARLGPDRLQGAYAWRSLIESGGAVAFGSDSPVEPVDVWAGIAAAVTRQGPDGEPFGGWMPHERISREQALAGFTSGAAWAGKADGRFGSLAPGEWADFLFVSADPLLAAEGELRTIAVEETWIAGRRAYRRD
ncbi:amidohydrolase [Croceicoccus sp. Ery5]|uniref:amidohydrolase n=1 Tax=Croceicoccus sp. Ery5 TaxID=1703340 RepID=UPI00351D6E90